MGRPPQAQSGMWVIGRPPRWSRAQQELLNSQVLPSPCLLCFEGIRNASMTPSANDDTKFRAHKRNWRYLLGESSWSEQSPEGVALRCDRGSREKRGRAYA